MNEQEKINIIAQLAHDQLRHQMYGGVYLKQENGEIVIRTPEGNILELPAYQEYEDD